MAKIVDLVVPNIGDFKNVEIIEILIAENQIIKKNDGIITLESDKSSVEVPSQFSGKIKNIKVKVGDKISEGDKIGEIEITSDELIQERKSENKKIEIQKKGKASNDITLLKIPSLGTTKKLIISEIFPLSMKEQGASIATSVQWFSNFMVSFTFLSMLNEWGASMTFLIYSTVCFCSMFFVYTFVVETKKISLEEINMEYVR